MELIERKIIKKIEKFISTDDIVILHGARQVGKTSILHIIKDKLDKQGKQTHYIDLEDLRLLEIFDEGPERVIKYLQINNILNKKKLFLFVDEIQYLKNPTNFLKLMYDNYCNKIKLIVSGSSSFEIKKKFKDSLVGRTIEFNIYPLSFDEFLNFKNVNINICEKITIKKTENELKDLYLEYILYGGYPKIVLETNKENKEIYLQQIIDTYIRKDIRDLANIKDILKFNKLLEILASQSGNLLNVNELSNTSKLARQTIDEYLFIMENTYILKPVYPYSSNLRSELFKTPKIYFYDTGIANLLWYKHLPEKENGNIFETAIFSELIKMDKIRKINYWRTQDKKKIDFIIQINRSIYPIEVKLNQAQLKLTALRYFNEKYKSKKNYVITLEKHKKKIDYIILYPWEIYSEF